ncbi:histidine kinase [Streptomyces sp. NPDC048277]|uniref:sensor histidine kinase n=1 Tax=Streptomyces sp. NPDC048277 TaxID=3155027 RepID=UPI0033E2FBBF
MENDGESVLDGVPTGVALVGTDGTIRWVNRAGAAILGGTRRELTGVGAPFRLGGPDGGSGEEVCSWSDGTRWLAYTWGASVHEGGDGTLVGFRDVTEQQQQHRRVAALARTAASMASNSSLEEVLGAMAAEIQLSPGVAGTQIITFAPGGDRLQLMGSAGFTDVETFFDLLMASRDRGADLATLRSMGERRQCVLPERRARMLADPSWQPLHAYVSQLDWEDFVSTPLLSRGKALGALNVYLASGHRATPAILEFLGAMAEQAALAVDYATLLHEERSAVRREERKRLARDLHDSVVQHVFSIGMQAKALGGIARRLTDPLAPRVEAVASEVTELVDAVQRDLRGVVLALQPSVSAKLGLLPALHALAQGIERRHDVAVDLAVDPVIEEGIKAPAFSEDVYQIISEALHNAVKHAAPTSVRVDARRDRDGHRLGIDIVDDGRWVPPGAGERHGFGLVSMRDRAGRWGGSVTVTTATDDTGTRVRAELPLPHSDKEQRRNEGTA